MTSCSITIEGIQDHFGFLGPFEGGDKITLFVVKGQIRQAVYLVERGQNELFITADLDIRMLGHLVMFIELLHVRERLVRSHDDVHILKVVEIGQDRFRLVFAMFAVGTKEHHDGLTPLF